MCGGCASHLDSYQGSAGFEASFIPCLDVGAPCAASGIYFCPLCLCWLQTHVVLLIVHSMEDPSGNPCCIICPCMHFFALLSTLPLSLISSTEVRSEERGILERAGVVQSLTVGVAPIVVVIASACTFTLHMALGYDLTAAQVLKFVNLDLSLRTTTYLVIVWMGDMISQSASLNVEISLLTLGVCVHFNASFRQR